MKYMHAWQNDIHARPCISFCRAFVYFILCCCTRNLHNSTRAWNTRTPDCNEHEWHAQQPAIEMKYTHSRLLCVSCILLLAEWNTCTAQCNSRTAFSCAATENRTHARTAEWSTRRMKHPHSSLLCVYFIEWCYCVTFGYSRCILCAQVHSMCGALCVRRFILCVLHYVCHALCVSWCIRCIMCVIPPIMFPSGHAFKTPPSVRLLFFHFGSERQMHRQMQV